MVVPKKSKGVQNFKKVVYFVVLTIFFGLISSFIFTRSEENSLLAELDEMKSQYDVLHKKLSQTRQVLGEIKDRDDNIYRAYFDMEPIPDDVRQAGFGGTDRYAKFSTWKYGNIVSEISKDLDVLNKQIILQSLSLDEIDAEGKEKELMLAHIPAIQPVENKNLKRMASGFGVRLHPILGIRKAHMGMDFSAAIGTPVYATGDATVKEAGRRGRYGNTVILNHGYGYQTLYAHLNSTAVKAGQQVKRGEVIGYVGNTGMSTGPHLHYEVIKDGVKVDPISFYHQDLSPEEFEILLEKSQEISVSLD